MTFLTSDDFRCEIYMLVLGIDPLVLRITRAWNAGIVSISRYSGAFCKRSVSISRRNTQLGGDLSDNRVNAGRGGGTMQGRDDSKSHGPRNGTVSAAQSPSTFDTRCERGIRSYVRHAIGSRRTPRGWARWAIRGHMMRLAAQTAAGKGTNASANPQLHRGRIITAVHWFPCL